MWNVFLYVFLASYVSSELTGEHVCQEEESYKVNVTRYFLRNITVRGYKWCLQVPPRCSTYDVHQINDTKIVEEENVRLVNKCCVGYVQTNDEKCIPLTCNTCVNGTCKEDGECDCKPGYRGPNCGEVCKVDSWGKNCQNECHCTKGFCNPVNGSCACNLHTNGCDTPCNNNDTICPTDSNSSTHLCNPFTKICANPTNNYKESVSNQTETPNYKLLKNGISNYEKPATLQKYHTFDVTTSKYNTIKQKSKNPMRKYVQERKKSTSFPYSYFTTQSIGKNENESTKKISLENSTTILVERNNHETEIVTKNTSNFETTQDLFVGEKSLSDNKEIANLKLNELNVPKIRNDSHLEVTHASDFQKSNNGIYFTVLLATLLTVLVIIAVAILLSCYSIRKRKTNMKITSDTELGSTTVSVTTRSIFHTPLPDPPVFKNPIFSTPLEPNGRSFEAHVICSMNIAKQQNKSRDEEIFYDHPPSTGSYRAAFIPDPPCLKKISPSDPIYDEIPCYKRLALTTSPSQSLQTESSTLYMNTNIS